jgi:glycosyltransferase involved in cell wall biosynthesis
LARNARALRVAINAQLLPGGEVGGVEQFTMGLVHGLGRLSDGLEEYLIVGHWLHPDLLAPYIGPNQRILSGPRGTRIQRAKRIARRALGPLYAAGRKVWRAARTASAASQQPSEVPESGGFFESLDVDLVHFPYQHFVRCNLPTIYNPHDVQHLHYPEFFTPEQIRWRETLYKAGCRESQAVAVDSASARDDIVTRYSVDPRNVFVILPGPPTELYEPPNDAALAMVKRKSRLPEAFALYPAQTWPHKNHLRLLEALALLRNTHRLSLSLVCTGRKNEHWPKIRQRMRELRLQDSVRFLGFVGTTEMRALYRLAQFVIFPSLFEGAGLPVLEAFAEGTPVACSAVTSLVEYGGDAVLPLDPTSVESIADAIRRMSSDGELRASLRERGLARKRLFSWERAAKTYRALYRRIARRPLTDEDRELLAAAQVSQTG